MKFSQKIKNKIFKENQKKFIKKKKILKKLHSNQKN